MPGQKERAPLEVFATGHFWNLIPDDHVLVRIDQVLDLGWLRADVAGCCCSDSGRPGIVHDRRRMREAEFVLAIRRFIGCARHEALPNHASLTRIRRRWGEDVFRRFGDCF